MEDSGEGKKPERPERRNEELEAFLARLRSDPRITAGEISGMVGRIHLNVSGLPKQRWFAPQGADGLVLKEIFEEIEALARRRGDPPFGSGPLNFVASFPRSGNTMVLQSLSKLGGVQTFTDEIATPRFMPFHYYPAEYPLARVVKSHRVLSCDPSCRYVYIVRDGRDILPSLAHMSRLQGAEDGDGPGSAGFLRRWIHGKRRRLKSHRFTRREEMADFIVWLKRNYRYGNWIDFHRSLEAIKGRENVLVVKYPDLLSSAQALRRIAGFLGIPFEEEALQEAYENKEDILKRLAETSANKKWGIGEEVDDVILYYSWSRNRTGSSWRESLDARARREFHKLGATPLLLEYGFETDPDWWRD